ncbi:MAG: alpha/beta hydrolase, partial [Deltaproteobacteria bacterium]
FPPLLATMPKSGVTVTRDLAYGPDPKQKLDVYQPEAATGFPVVVYVHGGALVAGDKNLNGEIYGNVLYFFARRGFLGINTTYRLAPKHAYPSGAEDVGATVKWIKQNATRFGGDPQRVYLVGHSSGALHVATWAYDSKIHGAGGPDVAGIVLISGRLRADNRADDPNGKKLEGSHVHRDYRVRPTVPGRVQHRALLQPLPRAVTVPTLHASYWPQPYLRGRIVQHPGWSAGPRYHRLYSERTLTKGCKINRIGVDFPGVSSARRNGAGGQN